jgi:hypothetical protein
MRLFLAVHIISTAIALDVVHRPRICRRFQLHGMPNLSAGEDELRNKLESILQAVDEGKSAEEIERMSGIKVTQLPKQSAEQELYDNLNDASVRARITDPVDFEEVTLMMQLNEEMRRAKRANNEPIVNSQLHDIMRDIQVDLSQTTVSVSLVRYIFSQITEFLPITFMTSS